MDTTPTVHTGTLSPLDAESILKLHCALLAVSAIALSSSQQTNDTGHDHDAYAFLLAGRWHITHAQALCRYGRHLADEDALERLAYASDTFVAPPWWSPSHRRGWRNRLGHVDVAHTILDTIRFYYERRTHVTLDYATGHVVPVDGI